MAYNPYDPYNQGIGTLDLGSFGLQQQPEENMTVAEAINYGVLPQAKEKFNSSEYKELNDGHPVRYHDETLMKSEEIK